MKSSDRSLLERLAGRAASPTGRLTLLALVYFLAARLGLAFIVQPEGFAIIWPAGGVALAALLLSPPRQWPAMLAVVFVANMLANLTSGNNLAVSLGFALANSLEPALCAGLMARWPGGRISFSRLVDVLGLVAAAALVNGATALVGALVPTLGFGASYWRTWAYWWISDGLGILIVTPLIVTWIRSGTLRSIAKPARQAENLAWVLLLSVAAWFIFGVDESGLLPEPHPYMLYPLLVWATLRFSPRASAAALALATIVSLVGTVAGTGSYPLGGDALASRLVAVQGFFCVASLTTLVLAAVLVERRKAEATLRQSEARYRELFENINSGVAVYQVIDDGRDFIFKDFNRAGERIDHQPRAELLGRSIFEARPGIEQFGLIDAFRQVWRTGQPVNHPVKLYQDERLSGWYENFIYKLPSGEIVTVFENLTERKQAEAEHERLLAELERKNRELESVIFIASHDLRSPLINIQGFGKNLRKYFELLSNILDGADTLETFRRVAQPVLVERVPNALRFIESSSAKMDVLIDGLLRLSRIGRIPLQIQPVDMSLLIQTLLDSLAFQIEQANAQVDVHGPLAGCRGDKNQLGQVFSNLLDNALKYRDPQRPLVITIACQVSGQEAIYSVADTGLGIPAEVQAKIWEIFRRLDESGSVPGEGLGLTIARRIVERHEGRLWVESQPGAGSCFYVALPAAEGIDP
ncbi:MAG: MASE1 domain-containing protein [Chloroflexota bacterium]